MQTLAIDTVLKMMHRLAAKNRPAPSSAELSAATGLSLATLKRQLTQLLMLGLIQKGGTARATRYALVHAAIAPNDALGDASPTNLPPAPPVPTVHPPWSARSKRIITYLSLPLTQRAPVTYHRRRIDDYVPNQSHLLPAKLAQSLAAEGAMHGQLPAGTYTLRVLEQLLLDLSWQSSRLEGNRYSLLQTEELFKAARVGQDTDAIMLLNHKRAIEFAASAVPKVGLTEAVLRNTHGMLLQDLLPDSTALGAVRQKMVRISGTMYIPTHAPQLLQEMLGEIVRKANLVANPVEAAFFLWVHIAYLQPFEDGNKRTSRLAANMPLMLYNCAPLSFMDITPGDYATAMLGMYEKQSAAIAADLFEWSYRRSIRKYAVVLAAASKPDAFRLDHRDHLATAMNSVVQGGRSAAQAAAALKLSAANAKPFKALLVDELAKLTPFNCARYDLSTKAVEKWLKARA